MSQLISSFSNFGPNKCNEGVLTWEIAKELGLLDSEVVTIPSVITYNGGTKRFTVLEAELFSYNKVIKEITLEEGYEVIEKMCFSHASVREIKLPNSLKKIEEGAFFRSNLIEIDIPDFTELADNVFAICTNLVRVKFPIDLLEIPDSCCYDCINLCEVKLPSTVQKIGGTAFKGCTQLKTVDIPNSLSVIEIRAFAGSGLVSIDLTNVKKIETCAFIHCSDLVITVPASCEPHPTAFDECKNVEYKVVENPSEPIPLILDMDWCERFFPGREGNVTINDVMYWRGQPYKIVKVAKDALSEADFTTITFNNIPEIECWACTLVRGLKTITVVGDTVLGEGCFACNHELETVSLPDTIIKYPVKLFSGCENLSFDIHDTVTEIGEYAFQYTKNVTYRGTATGAPWGAMKYNGVEYPENAPKN